MPFFVLTSWGAAGSILSGSPPLDARAPGFESGWVRLIFLVVFILKNFKKCKIDFERGIKMVILMIMLQSFKVFR